jgi:hypothetical protein
MRQVHVAGERMFVDYAATTLEVVDGTTGEVRVDEIERPALRTLPVDVLGSAHDGGVAIGRQRDAATLEAGPNRLIGDQLVVWPRCHSGGRTTPTTGPAGRRPWIPRWAKSRLSRCKKVGRNSL